MRILTIIIAVLAAYFAFQQYGIHQDKKAFNVLVKSTDSQSINLFDLKISLDTQVTALCQSIDTEFSRVDDCIEIVELNKEDCDLVVFRLAPVEFASSEEALDYGIRYQQCVFGREFSNLVDKSL
jgi:hypothetical protein